MSAIIVIAALAFVLFALSYIAKRKFGILGLGLAAGAVISTYAANGIAPFMVSQGVAPGELPMVPLVEAALVLLPALILLVSGPKYDSKLLRVLGSLLFVVVALALVAESLASALVMDETSSAVFTAFMEFQPVIIIGGMILAVFDVMASRSHSKAKSKKKAEH